MANKEDWSHLLDSPDILLIQMKVNKLRRKKLQKTPEWDSFLKSEWKQLNRYKDAGMFGDPVQMEEWMTVLPWIWTYLYKEDPITAVKLAKARGTCNGGPRYDEAVTLAETYAACVEQPIHRLTWAISAALNLYCKGYDVGNAFAEAPVPVDPFFMYPDAQYRKWWEGLGNDPIPEGYVIPIQKALQGHPESPRLWDKPISKMLIHELGFKETVHEPCLYYKRDVNNNITLILRQVDDFLVPNKSSIECDLIGQMIQERMINPLNNLGTIQKFNGVDIDQTQSFNHIHCETYINKTVRHHNWQHKKTRAKPIPMKTDIEYQTRIQLEEGPESLKEQQQQLEKQMGFSYQQCIGELIYALTICQIDISIAVITLSQHSNNPAQIHYEAVKHIFVYLKATKKDELTYWRTKPQMDLPYAPNPITISKDSVLRKFEPQHNALEIVGACDATWASDCLHRRSIAGIVMMLAGAAIYYHTRLQLTVTQSSTEAEFTNMANVGKVALYLKWILEELVVVIMDNPTPIHADNQGAFRMANAQQPTCRTRHVEMKHFVILQWTDDKFINLIDTKTDENYSNSLSKPTARPNEILQTQVGRRRPAYKDETGPNKNSQKGIVVHYFSLSTYRTNPIVSLLRYDSLIDSAGAA